jgi:hypothetical protein
MSWQEIEEDMEVGFVRITANEHGAVESTPHGTMLRVYSDLFEQVGSVPATTSQLKVGLIQRCGHGKPKGTNHEPVQKIAGMLKQGGVRQNIAHESLKHLSYLQKVSRGESPAISVQTARIAREAWLAIRQATDFEMPIPAACTGPDGQMFYSWDKAKHHLELEIFPDMPAEFFYRNRQSNELWGEEYVIGEPLPSDAVAKFKYFL